jgi:hypothetical protein
MAATRNKFMYSEFCVDRFQVNKQKEMLMNPEAWIHNRPAMPVGYNVPRMPSTANNAVDIESTLYGIGANNYIFPKKKVVPDATHLPMVQFYQEPRLFVPILPPVSQQERPLNF